MSDMNMPEYPALVFHGYTEDQKKYIFTVGKARREIPIDDEWAMEEFKYAIMRLDSLIRYKREKIAIDSIM